MNEVTTPHATDEATPHLSDHATTPQGVTSRQVTVREAAEALGVSTETIRRMIRSGRLRAQKVHRPQGTAFVVELEDATAQVTADATGDVTVGRHDATSQATMSPALLAAEAWSRGVVEPLTRLVEEQQRQLIEQAETIGSLRAERDAARDESGLLRGELAALKAAPAPSERPVAGRWRRFWPALVLGVVPIVVAVIWLAVRGY